MEVRDGRRFRLARAGRHFFLTALGGAFVLAGCQAGVPSASVHAGPAKAGCATVWKGAAAPNAPDITLKTVEAGDANDQTVADAAGASSAPAVPDYYLHLPPHPSTSQPLQVLLVLHGFGDNGPQLAARLLSYSDANDWIVAAPTIQYNSLTSAAVTRSDDIHVAGELSAILRDVPRRSGYATQPKALVLGFSRGASMAERFATFDPGQVFAVAALSGGAYTLPQSCGELDGQTQMLPLPLGTADIDRWLGHPFDATDFVKIPFWLSVGGGDTNPSPSAYDALLGISRVERGQALQQALQSLGMRTRFTIFPGVGHRATDEMLLQATSFLRAAQLG